MRPERENLYILYLDILLSVEEDVMKKFIKQLFKKTYFFSDHLRTKVFP